jgi:hypothetical protein
MRVKSASWTQRNGGRIPARLPTLVQLNREAAREAAMATRVTNSRAGAGKPFNWLKWLDEEVRKFPSEANWLQHPPFQFARCRLFMMARYPHLKRRFPDEVLSREFSRGEHQISEDPEARHALNGLSDQKRKEAAALSLDIIESLQTYTSHGRSRKKFYKLAAEAPSRTRMLIRKREKAHRALEDLRNYAESLDMMLSWEDVLAAKECLKLLQNLKNPEPEFYESLRTEYPALKDPATLGTVQLYWFFRHGCRLSGDEAEVRVAGIRNAFWTEHSVPRVHYRPEYQTGESKGCDAVHVTVLRFKQGTPRRKTL